MQRLPSLPLVEVLPRYRLLAIALHAMTGLVALLVVRQCQ